MDLIERDRQKQIQKVNHDRNVIYITKSLAAQLCTILAKVFFNRVIKFYFISQFKNEANTFIL